MSGGAQFTFSISRPLRVPSGELTRLELTDSDQAGPNLHYDAAEGVVFDTDGWYEVLMTVEWDPTDTVGTRFAHTKIPGQQPLHSEAIAAAVLARISEGRQLLRGNSIFGPGITKSLQLEVWHDSDSSVEVRAAQLLVRELQVPWESTH